MFQLQFPFNELFNPLETRCCYSYAGGKGLTAYWVSPGHLLDLFLHELCGLRELVFSAHWPRLRGIEVSPFRLTLQHS